MGDLSIILCVFPFLFSMSLGFHCRCIFTSLFRFIPSCFILLEAIINGILISFLASRLWHIERLPSPECLFHPLLY